MRVYADASVDMVLRPGFLDIHPKEGSPRRIAWEEPPKKGGLGFPTRRVLAVPSAKHAWVGAGRGVKIIPLDGDDARDVASLGVRILDAIAVGKGRVLACAHLEGEEGASLRVVDGAAPDFKAATVLKLPSVVKVEWPAGAVWMRGKEAWPEKDKDNKGVALFDHVAPGHPQKDGARFFDSVVLTHGPHGIAGASVQNGVVFALADDASEIIAAFRVPSAPETELHPVRTKDGIALTVVRDGKDAAVLHIALDGRVLAHRSKVGKSNAVGMSPPMPFGDSIFVVDRQKAAVLLELALTDFEVRTKHDVPPGPFGAASIAFGTDLAMLSDGVSALRIVVKNGGPTVALVEALGTGTASAEATPKPKKKVDDDLGLDEEESSSEGEEDAEDEDEDPIAAFVSMTRPRATGSPSLTLAEAASPSTWALTSGGALNVTVGFANLGGASKGVYVEVGGQAVLSGLVSASDLRLGSTSTKFEKKGAAYRAEVAAIDLSAGLLPDPDEKRGGGKVPLYDGIQRANVSLQGTKAGAGLLTVRIGPMKAEPGRGSIVQGKTLVVK